MIPAQQLVELALQAATVDETIVIVTDCSDASLRWAGNSMTTNGVSTTRVITVISIVRIGTTSHTGTIRTSDVNPAAIGAVSRVRGISISRARNNSRVDPLGISAGANSGGGASSLSLCWAIGS